MKTLILIASLIFTTNVFAGDKGLAVCPYGKLTKCHIGERLLSWEDYLRLYGESRPVKILRITYVEGISVLIEYETTD